MHSWGTHLTTAVADPDCRVTREPGRYGYMLAQPIEDSSVTAEQPNSTYVARESRLYDLLVEWLRAQGYEAKNTSNTIKGKKWGNPDVIGIKIVELPLQSAELELASIEAKTSANQWRYEIFEAVSHKRFAHRSYFAFAIGTDEPGVQGIKEYKDLRVYGERFGIGILAVFIPPAKYEELMTSAQPGESLWRTFGWKRFGPLYTNVYQCQNSPSL